MNEVAIELLKRAVPMIEGYRKHLKGLSCDYEEADVLLRDIDAATTPVRFVANEQRPYSFDPEAAARAFTEDIRKTTRAEMPTQPDLRAPRMELVLSVDRLEPAPPLSREFERDLARLINRHCVENGSDTPDFLLAAFVVSVVEAWNSFTRLREKWHGRAKQWSIPRADPKADTEPPGPG